MAGILPDLQLFDFASSTLANRLGFMDRDIRQINIWDRLHCHHSGIVATYSSLRRLFRFGVDDTDSSYCPSLDQYNIPLHQADV